MIFQRFTTNRYLIYLLQQDNKNIKHNDKNAEKIEENKIN